jgi:glycosyltransferase involved in cell wall biosynthesis
MKDTFSVAMCTYNGSRYLNAQLESIASQTRLPNELVICDDDSVDDSVRIIQHFASSAPFPVRLSINPQNLGSTKSFENAIRRCEGELIALADQDDVWLPRKLETIEAEFQRAPDVGLVFSDAELVDENLRPLGMRLWTSIGFDEMFQSELRSSRALNVLLPGWTVTGATMAFRSQFRAITLPIPNDIPMIHDGWIAAVVAAVANVAFIEQPLIKYRQHQRQQIGVPTADKTKAQIAKGDFRQSMRRANSYAQLISVADRLRSRLIEPSNKLDCHVAIHQLDARIHHLRTRDLMPESRLRRVPHVVRELCTQRYHLYSNGLYSALKDLLA